MVRPLFHAVRPYRHGRVLRVVAPKQNKHVARTLSLAETLARNSGSFQRLRCAVLMACRTCSGMVRLGAPKVARETAEWPSVMASPAATTLSTDVVLIDRGTVTVFEVCRDIVGHGRDMLRAFRHGQQGKWPRLYLMCWSIGLHHVFRA